MPARAMELRASGGAAFTEHGVETGPEQTSRPGFTGQRGQPQPGADGEASGSGRCWPNAACGTSRDATTPEAPCFQAEGFGT